MMKNLLLLLLLLLSVTVYAQKIIKTEQVTDHSIHITSSDFEGVIFFEKYKGEYDVYDTAEYKKNSWYTPTVKDIESTEKVLVSELKNKAKTKKGKYNDAKIVFNELKSSYRQYIGYINPQGEKLICINGFPDDEGWAKERSRKPPYNLVWYQDIFRVFDGGPSFWHITINLTTKKIIFFGVNGIA